MNKDNSVIFCDEMGGEYETASDEIGPAITREKWDNPEEVQIADILEPDHPLMKRFQEALKIHLERQNQRLSEEILELKTQLKETHKQHEETGEQVYVLQQEVCKQQNTIESIHNELNSVSSLRKSLEDEVNNLRKKHKDESCKLVSAQNKESEMQSELVNIVNLENQFKQWEEEMASEIAVTQRISEKLKVDRKQLLGEKRKQDIYIVKLMSEVSNLESRLVLLGAQLKAKREEREIINQTVTDANTDLECLNKEQRRLLQSWNGLIIFMKQRDKIYDETLKQRFEVKEQLLLLKKELEAFNKICHNEMLENEKFTITLQHIQNEVGNLDVQINNNKMKQINLEAQLGRLSPVVNQIQRDLDFAEAENQKVLDEVKLLEQEIQKLINQKSMLEKEIVLLLQEHEATDKISKYTTKKLEEVQTKTRTLEGLLYLAENDYSQVLLGNERSKADLDYNSKTYDDIKTDLISQEQKVENMAAQLNHIKNFIMKKQSNHDALGKKIETLLEKRGGDDRSPQEVKIAGLQASIDEMEEKIEQQQIFWLREQRNAVSLSHQRNDQLHEIDILRKQAVILDQKNLKIEYEISCHRKEEQLVIRSINSLLNKLTRLNQDLCNCKDYKQNLDKENILTQFEFIGSLKEAETESCQLQADIADLEKEKQELMEKLMQAQRENLAWEKKHQLALETKQDVTRERSSEGEVCTMRNEIHRMQVRYSQLVSAQERLAHDLEHCILRRDSIMDVSVAREKRSEKGQHNSRVNIQKKLEDMKNRIKQVKNETRAIEQQMDEVKVKQEDVLERIAEKQENLQQIEKSITDIDNQLDECLLLKFKNLELLVRKQRKARMFNDLKEGRYRTLYRQENLLQAEIQHQKVINSDLIFIVESLVTDFPGLQFRLKKILNTLQTKC